MAADPRIFLLPIDMSKNEIRNFVVQNLASAPGSPVEGLPYWNTTDKTLYIWDGTAWLDLGGDIRDVDGTAPIQVSVAAGVATVSIDPASGSTAGSMSITHYNLVNGATASPTINTIVLRDGSGRAQIEDPSAPKDIANKQWVQQQITMGQLWKELILHPDQLDSVGGVRGLRQAGAFFAGALPVANDTFILDDGVTTETFTFKSSEAVAFDVAIGASATDAMTNLAQAINDDSTLWGATFVSNLDALFGGEAVVVYRLDQSADNYDDRMYGVWATQANASYIDYNGEYDYSKTTSAQLPATDPAVKNFGFGRQQTSLTPNEMHVCLSGDGMYTWDDDANVWQQTDTGAFTASNGIQFVGNDIQGINATTAQIGVQRNATAAEVKARTLSNATVTPDTLADFPDRYTETVNGDNSTTDFTINHALNNSEVTVEVWKAFGNKAKVEADTHVDDANNIGVNFSPAPLTGEDYIVIVDAK